MKAFVPPGWVAQEALRLELYRRISIAGDHDALAQVRDETDRPLRRAAARGRDAVRGRVAPRDRRARSASRRSPRSASRSASGRSRSDDALAVRSDGTRVRRHVSRGEADAEPRPGARVRRRTWSGGWSGGSWRRPDPTGSDRRRRRRSRIRPSAVSRIDSSLVTPVPIPFRRAVARALLASRRRAAARRRPPRRWAPSR